MIQRPTNFTPRWKCFNAASRLTLHAFSLDDVDGDGERCKNCKADCQCDASLHSNVETFMWIYAYNNISRILYRTPTFDYSKKFVGF